MSKRRQTNNHHLNFTNASFSERSLSKEVRNNKTFQVEDAAFHAHRLLHRVFARYCMIPEVPDTQTLLEMRELAPYGLEFVMDRIDHPIIENYEKQLIILSIAPAVALRKLEKGDFEIYGVTRERTYAGSVGGVITHYGGVLLDGSGSSGLDVLGSGLSTDSYVDGTSSSTEGTWNVGNL